MSVFLLNLYSNVCLELNGNVLTRRMKMEKKLEDLPVIDRREK